jgi:pyridoxal phosphate enzyme (YggS family)
MPTPLDIVRLNLASVRERIANAAQAAGRAPSEITLVGVTKYVDAETAGLLVEAGCRELGESRPQQLWAKAESLSLLIPAVRWHMIGHMQRNKVASTVPYLTLLHSLDSMRLLETIGRSAAAGSRRVMALLEVNCSGDAEKHGFAPDELPAVLESLAAFPSVQIQGLMTMAAREGGADTARQNFADLRELRDKLAPLAPAGTTLDELSMGMSGDFEEAIAEGATIVRVGSALWEGLPLPN